VMMMMMIIIMIIIMKMIMAVTAMKHMWLGRKKVYCLQGSAHRIFTLRGCCHEQFDFW
jgi:hypothetical protein